MDAKMALCHSERGCNERLEDSGWCKRCGMVTDLTRATLIPYCPNCNCPLEDLVCPRCNVHFNLPRK